MKLPRRTAVRTAAAALLPALGLSAHGATSRTMRRVRPGDPEWPAPTAWDELNRVTNGNLIKVQPLLAPCETAPSSEACTTVLKDLKNPYYIGEQPAGTETSGWVDAWRSAPSVYAVAAHSTSDVAAAVNFARTHRLRLVIKGGGHSYLGGSNAADSLLLWMRPMDAITLHDSFTPQGCKDAQPAVSVQTGARWLPVYNAVTTAAGRYVQGGGCTTVGVAGLVLGSGFGSFSKNYATGAAGLLEAEIVTADGTVRIANPCTNPDLFWALKGGGAGGLGAVTRLTLRTRTLPQFCGAAFGSVQAKSDAAFRRLIAFWTDFYATHLFNRHWGESVVFQPENALSISMVFHDLDRTQAEAAFKPFVDFVAATPGDFTVTHPMKIVAVPAQHWWDVDYLDKSLPAMMIHDPRPDVPHTNAWYQGDAGQVGFFLHGYEGAWLPATLLARNRQASLNDALFAGTRHWRVALHYNKGLAGAPAEELAAVRNTAINPAVTEAFTYAIIAHGGPPAYPGMPGPGPDLQSARRNAAAIAKAIGVLRTLVPNAGSYVSEASFHDPDWRRRSFGPNYPRLLEIKHRYDPDGLFFTHHGVGSEEWSADGFTRL